MSGGKIPPTLRPQWGHWVKCMRRRLDWPKYRLAVAVGINPSYLTLIERDGYVPTLRYIHAIAEALEGDVDQALLMAGYAPQLSLGALLEVATRRPLQPALALAMKEVRTLAPAQQRELAELLPDFIDAARSARAS